MTSNWRNPFGNVPVFHSTGVPKSAAAIPTPPQARNEPDSVVDSRPVAAPRPPAPVVIRPARVSLPASHIGEPLSFEDFQQAFVGDTSSGNGSSRVGAKPKRPAAAPARSENDDEDNNDTKVPPSQPLKKQRKPHSAPEADEEEEPETFFSPQDLYRSKAFTAPKKKGIGKGRPVILKKTTKTKKKKPAMILPKFYQDLERLCNLIAGNLRRNLHDCFHVPLHWDPQKDTTDTTKIPTASLDQNYDWVLQHIENWLSPETYAGISRVLTWLRKLQCRLSWQDIQDNLKHRDNFANWVVQEIIANQFAQGGVWPRRSILMNNNFMRVTYVEYFKNI